MKATKNFIKKAKKDPQKVYQAVLAAESQGRLHEALEPLEALIEVLPNDLALKKKCGSLLIALRKFNRASGLFMELARKEPLQASHYSNWGVCLSNRNLFEGASAAFQRALILKPDHAIAWNNLAGVTRDSGRAAESRALYQRAIEVDPDYAAAAWGLAIVSLMLGDFEAGLPLYEKGFLCGERFERFSGKSRWDGKPIAKGKRLLISAEEGYGDAIQMARYLLQPELHDADIILEVRTPLIPLLRDLRPHLTVIAKGIETGPYDLYCPVMSLPFALSTRIDSIPAPAPIKIDPEYKGKWADRLGPQSIKRIGLAWSGNPEHKNDKNRSMPLDALLPLLTLNAQFHVVQKDIRAEDLRLIQNHPEIQVHSEALVDFADTAALINAMDVVVSVDTSMVHVAGSLNKPCHVLLPLVADYRWLLERRDSPWYPSLTLYRQSKIGDWSPLVRAILTSLKQSFAISASPSEP